MAGPEVRLIHIPDSGPNKGEVIEVLETTIDKPHCGIMPLGPLKIKFSNIFSDSISYCFDRPFKVLEIEKRENGMDIILEALPEKRCGNCKHSHESVCENCFGVNGTIEITSDAKGCKNWEKEDN